MNYLKCLKDIKQVSEQLVKEFINKIKLVKGICEDNRLGFLKRIDNDITKATVLLSNSYLRNKNRLLS